ncbi:O-antigen ligase family protein [Lysobacter cavernae]|uniref:O-antigen ligase family protein n=1 Tax=Lysobacter cavernae TaxID=1685901 RepID=A0ABV7RJM4_9GAMM
MNAPLPDARNAAPAERFPLAARALRTTTARPQAAAAQVRSRVSARAHAPNNWVLYAFLFLLPLQNLQTGYLPDFGGGLNFLNIGFALSLLGAWMTRGRIASNEPVNRWVLAYAVYALVSLLVGYQFVGNADTHANVLKDHLVGVFIVYLVQMSVQDWTGVRRILIATILPLPYIAKVVWVQHQSVASWHYSDDLRIKGTFSLLGANELAAFCVTVAVMLFALLMAAKLSRVWRLALLAGIACMVVGVLYAYSRTAYVGLILGLVTVIMVWRGRWKMLLPLLLIAALLPNLMPQSIVERFDSTSVEEGKRDESTELRFEYWKVAMDNFQNHPFTGTGFHTFHHREINPYGKDTHNLYIRTLTEGGVLGAVVLLGLLIAVLRTARRELSNSRTGSLRYALALGLVGAWMALVCGNFFGDRFTYYPMIAYFWTYVALVVKARHLPEEPAR